MNLVVIREKIRREEGEEEEETRLSERGPIPA